MSDTKPTPPHTEVDLLSMHCPIKDRTPNFADGSRVKLCEGCDTPVHNLSAMTQTEAEALIDTDERLCVRYEVSPTGHPVFQTAIAGGIGLALGMVAACGGTPTEAEPTPPEPATETSTTTETATSLYDQNIRVGTVAPPKESKAPVRIGKVRHTKPKKNTDADTQ